MISKISLINTLKTKMKNCPDLSHGEEILLCQLALNLSPKEFFSKKTFNPKEIKKIQKALSRRLKGEPLNKIFKHQNFFGINFFINKNVLAPRPETELLCQKALNLAQRKLIKESESNLAILDLCCGSGCIGLTLAKHCPQATLTLSDVSPKALTVARKNKKLLDIKNAKIIKSNLFSQLKTCQKFDIITCNPPYIETNIIPKLSISVTKYDPLLALDGGSDGLDFYRKIAKNADKFLAKDGNLFLEIGFSQKPAVEQIFKEKGFKTTFFKDYSGLDRVVEVKRGNYDR